VPRLVIAFGIVSISVAGGYVPQASPQHTIPCAGRAFVIIAGWMREVLTLF
jgi:hypothetical protein